MNVGNMSVPIRNYPKRNLEVDVIKAICIILVVIGHIIPLYVYPETFKSNIVFKICYSFHMPLFIFIGGGVSSYKSVEKISQNQWIIARFKRLMIPYIIWSIFLETLLGEYAVISYLFFRPAYWYLINLFLCDVILFISVKIKKHAFVAMGVLYLLFAGAFGFLGDNNLVVKNVVYFFPFYAVGYICFSYKDRAIFAKIKKYSKISLILYPLSMYLYSYGYDLWTVRIQNIPYIGASGKIMQAGLYMLYNHLIVPALGICFVWIIVEKIVRKNCFAPAVNALAYIGRYTIYIYFFDGFVHNFLPTSWFKPSLASELAVFAIATLIPLIIAKIMSYAPKISRILFGQ